VQLEFFDVPSPCIGICQADKKGYCLGCSRTREERQTWKDFSIDQKQKVIKLCIQRKKRKVKRIEQEQALIQSQDITSEQNVESDVKQNIQPSLLIPESIDVKTQNDDIDFEGFEL